MNGEKAAYLEEKQKEINSIVNGTISELQASKSNYLQRMAGKLSETLAALEKNTKSIADHAENPEK